ncbi:MAG: hypothetical protein IKL24_03315 [Clostridia bacterium]|nr:hypothetical protein [Clostridia bacterium]
MKFNITRPPTEGSSLNERHERLVSWLFLLSEELNCVLSNLGAENFSKGARESLFGNKEEKNDDL